MTPQPTALERSLRVECDYIEDANFSRFIAEAEDRYVEAVAKLFDSDRLQQPNLKSMFDEDKSVWVWKQKLSHTVLECWKEHEIEVKEREQPSGATKYGVPRFWADLWLVTLAREIGRRDGIHPVTDLLKTEMIIRTSYELDNDVDRAAINEQMKGVFLKIGLPAPAFEGIKTEKPDLKEWASIKSDLAGVRSEYHEEVAGFLEQVPVFLESHERISRLVKETRDSLNDKISHRWSKSISKAGWSMFGASASILFAGVVEPEFLVQAVGVSTAIQLVYMLGEFRATRHEQQQALLYEYQLGQRLAT